MSTQWTDSDPGAGSMASVSSLAAQLNRLETNLSSGLSDLRKADDVFLDQWIGQSATGARTQLSSLLAKAKAYEKAIRRVRSALPRYADEVEEIKELAAIQIKRRKAAQEALQDQLVNDPGAFDPERGGSGQRELENAVAALRALAVRRQSADDSVLAEVRAAIATTWEIAPEDYPSDRTWYDQAGYEYVIDDGLGFSTDEYTAEELMELFKKYPKEVFPFDVAGNSSTFRDGALFTLSDTIFDNGSADPYESGDVVVTTTGTSVKFTVVSDRYFDGPGSTIEFSIVEVDGEWVLRKTAIAVDANQAAAIGAEWMAELTWNDQAESLKDVVDKYGRS